MNPIVRYIVKGSVRGLISSHQGATAELDAYRAKAQDVQACRKLGGGAYSDVQVYAIHENGNQTGPYYPSLEQRAELDGGAR